MRWHGQHSLEQKSQHRKSHRINNKQCINVDCYIYVCVCIYCAFRNWNMTTRCFSLGILRSALCSHLVEEKKILAAVCHARSSQMQINLPSSRHPTKMTKIHADSCALCAISTNTMLISSTFFSFDWIEGHLAFTLIQVHFHPKALHTLLSMYTQFSDDEKWESKF